MYSRGGGREGEAVLDSPGSGGGGESDFWDAGKGILCPAVR
jgi:hypothetical protein